MKKNIKAFFQALAIMGVLLGFLFGSAFMYNWVAKNFTGEWWNLFMGLGAMLVFCILARQIPPVPTTSKRIDAIERQLGMVEQQKY